MNIEGKVAVITGAASGMGAETARHLAAKGAKVALLDLNAEALTTIAEETRGLALLCDVTNAEDVEAVFAKITAELGEIRACVNCAGICPAKRIVGRNGPMPLADFNQVIEINLIGSFNTMRLAAASMMAYTPFGDSDERGVIINTASVAAYEGQIGQAAYSASKGGIVAMTLPAARELAKFGVRVMAIAPGIMSTPMVSNMPQQVQASLAAGIPFPNRFGRASEFAALVMHILDNAFLNGSVIRLDGATRMTAK